MEFGIALFLLLPTIHLYNTNDRLFFVTFLYRHTSVVVFGKEVFYGQGLDTSLPGRSHVSNHFLENNNNN